MRDFLKLFLNPLVLILLIAAVSSAVLGDAPSAAIIIVIALLSNVLDFTQTHRSQRAVAELQARVAPTATVLRDGKWQEVRRTDIVPGDVIRRSAGDLVAADARLLEARDLYVQQGALTGESLPVEKRAPGTSVSTSPAAENMVFLGTSVVSGTASAEVIATGARTAFGLLRSTACWAADWQNEADLGEDIRHRSGPGEYLQDIPLGTLSLTL